MISSRYHFWQLKNKKEGPKNFKEYFWTWYKWIYTETKQTGNKNLMRCN